MNVHIHIERLILEGIDMPAGQRPFLQTAIETELTDLLLAEGLAPGLQTGGAFGTIQGSPLHLQNTQALVLGQQIAGSLYGGIAK